MTSLEMSSGVAMEAGALNAVNSAVVGLFPVAGENVFC